MASPASALLLNAAIWGDHVDGGGRNCPKPRCGKFYRGVVNVKVQNGFILISVYFVLAMVHDVKLPSLKRKRQGRSSSRKVLRLMMGDAPAVSARS
jgi:hypothetical protein